MLLTSSDRPGFPEEGGVSIFMTVHDRSVDERRSTSKPTPRRETGELGERTSGEGGTEAEEISSLTKTEKVCKLESERLRKKI